MKYLYPILLLLSIMIASCKSDTSVKESAQEVASETISEIKDEIVQEELEPANAIDTEEITSEKDGVITDTKELIVEKKETITPSTKKEAKKVVTESTTTISETVKEPVKEKAKEVVEEVKTETKTTSPKPEKIIEPNLKVTVPIEQGERKPAIDNSYEEKVEKVDIKKNTKSNVPNKPGAMNIDHSSFHKLLSSNVSSSGGVNYKAIKSNISQLDNYLSNLSKVEPTTLSRSAQLAFWINAYNAFTIKKIADNYPLKSIKDLNGGKPWDDKWINLDGKTLSLNDIENNIIRPRFKDARIHFAVNCAAQSCPPLHNVAYSGGNLNTNLENSTKAFINNPKYNKIAKDKVVISKIFDWYKVDFGDVITFLNKYSTTKINDNAAIEYMDYDWALNSK